MALLVADPYLFLTFSVPYRVCTICTSGQCNVLLTSVENKCIAGAVERLMLEEEVLFLQYARVFVSKTIALHGKYGESESELADIPSAASCRSVLLILFIFVALCAATAKKEAPEAASENDACETPATRRRFFRNTVVSKKPPRKSFTPKAAPTPSHTHTSLPLPPPPSAHVHADSSGSWETAHKRRRWYSDC